MRYREVFIVFPRTLKSGRKVYYYQTYDSEGKRTPGRSTGAVRARDARAYCMKLYRDGMLGVNTKKVPTLSGYSKGWWDIKTCRYLKSRIARRKISASYARQAKRNLEKHIIPEFGKKRLDTITSHEVDSWLMSYLDRGWSANSVNLFLTILKIMLGMAVKEGLIERNPCDSVQRAAVRNKPVEIMTVAEVKQLFDPAELVRVWGDELHYTLNMLSATTGMRIGEILGLKGGRVSSDYVEVSVQFNDHKELTETKTHDSRFVTIPAVVSRGLGRLKELNGSGFVFSTDGGTSPISRSQVRDRFRRALTEIGVEEVEQNRRGLSFHKWRHFFNTTLRLGNVADAKVMKLTGHKSEAMMEHYTHFDPRAFSDVRRIQESISLGTFEGDRSDGEGIIASDAG